MTKGKTHKHISRGADKRALHKLLTKLQSRSIHGVKVQRARKTSESRRHCYSKILFKYNRFCLSCCLFYNLHQFSPEQTTIQEYSLQKFYGHGLQVTVSIIMTTKAQEQTGTGYHATSIHNWWRPSYCSHGNKKPRGKNMISCTNIHILRCQKVS
jgi:hypothetical protein